MSGFTKVYQDFFTSEAGKKLLADIETISQTEQTSASNATDMQESFAHTQRSKGVQLALNKMKNTMVRANKPGQEEDETE